jgi:hypothetical protein
MNKARAVLLSLSMVLLCSLFSAAQQSATAANATNAVPPLIPFSSVATDEGGSSLSGIVNITFSLYAAQQGGAPLWTETQNNIQLDATGHYSVQLGITQPNGVPTTLFTTTEARWLGVRIAEQGEQPRALLLSVPYALKAGDAATIGGLPPSAFVLAAPPSGSSPTAPMDASATPQNSAPPPTGTAVTGTGTVNFLPLWDSTSDIISSVLFQSGTGTTAKLGINTTTPASTLDVKGGGTIRGTLSLPATGNATATKGANSQPLALAASSFSSTTGKAVAQTFQWQAEPVGNDTPATSATLNLLFGAGTTKPAETGLNIASTGVITFNAAQTFPNTIAGITTANGSGLTGGATSGTPSLSLLNTCTTNQVLQWTGTAWACATISGGGGGITGVTAGTDLTGGGTSGNVTLNLDTTKVPQLGTANTFTGNQTVMGNVIATTGYEIQFAGQNYLFAYGSPFIGSGLGNSYLGFAGNSMTTGVGNVGVGSFTLSANTSGAYNTAVGLEALLTNSSGEFNTAVGTDALFANGGGTSSTGNGNTALGHAAAYSNLTGYDNTAVGFQTLFNNTTGVYNTATGGYALNVNTTGNYNTALGYQAGPTTANLTNSTAIGANALVSESNALVLGGTGSNAVSVGIGTAAPAFTLDVHGTANFTGNVTFAPSQSFSGTGGIINATTGFDIGGTPFAFGSTSTFNSFLGFSGNSTATSTFNFAAGESDLAFLSGGDGGNTAVGSETAFNITTGANNTAVGTNALLGVTNGYQNTVVGENSAEHTNGFNNTAIGVNALINDITGNGNTALGAFSGPDPASTGLVNATTVGGGATVSASNSLVLGDTTAGSPGKAFVNVGIGTAVPRSILEASVYAPSTTNGGLGPTITLTNSGGGGGTSTSLDFNSYAPFTTGTYNPAARILVTDAGSFSDNILFQSNIPGAPNQGLQTNMEIYSAGGLAAWGSNASSTSTQPGGIGITATGGSNEDFAANGGEGGNFTGGVGLTGGSGVTVAGGAGNVGGDGIDAAAGVGNFLSGNGYAGNFNGDVNVTGKITAGTKDFKIDHPLDPANKYLYHSSVESSEMMNIYTGNVTTDGDGSATVQLPAWFEALNTDFRYQLTVMGQFAQAIVSRKVAGHQFGIRTDKPNVEVSWQITGVRQDAYAKAHPLVVEQAKNARERGHYIHPDLYGAAEEQSIEWARHPEMMKRMQETRARQLAAAQGQTRTTRPEILPLAVPPTPKETPQLHTPRVAPVRPATGPKPLVRAELQPLAAQPR